MPEPKKKKNGVDLAVVFGGGGGPMMGKKDDEDDYSDVDMEEYRSLSEGFMGTPMDDGQIMALKEFIRKCVESR